MRKTCYLAATVVLALSVTLPAQQASQRVRLGDWPDLRGPNRDGISRETGLISTWKLNGENFLWRVPYGGRSTPVVMGDRVYVQNPVGRGPALQERGSSRLASSSCGPSSIACSRARIWSG